MVVSVALTYLYYTYLLILHTLIHSCMMTSPRRSMPKLSLIYCGARAETPSFCTQSKELPLWNVKPNMMLRMSSHLASARNPGTFKSSGLLCGGADFCCNLPFSMKVTLSAGWGCWSRNIFVSIPHTAAVSHYHHRPPTCWRACKDTHTQAPAIVPWHIWSWCNILFFLAQ